MNQLSNKKRLIFLFLVSLFLIQTTALMNNNSNLIFQKENNSNVNSNKLSSLTVSGPITITSDSDFSAQATSNGWSGTGISTDPYIIQNLQIVNATNNTNGISISGLASTYFVIKNNYISMTGYGSTGIYISGSSNLGTIENNTLYNNNYYGIELYTSSGNTISYNTITNSTSSSGGSGIYLFVSNSNMIEYNNISYNYAGIRHSSSCSYNTYYNNTFTHNLDYAIWSTSFFSYNTFTKNYVAFTGNSIMYFQSSTTNNIFSSNSFEHNTADGIRFASGSSNNTFNDNLFYDNYYGIWSNIGQSYVYNNTFKSNQYGLELISSVNGTYENNTFINNNYGIFVSLSSNFNYFFNNTLVSNNYAFNVLDNNNSFFDNNIINNTYGFDVTGHNNTFYGNNLLHNSVQASVSYSDNQFDNGTLGNFWLNYVANAVDANKDGIGDSPYLVSTGVYDYYPLMIWHDENLPPEFLKAPSNVTYSEGNAINYTWKLIDESPDSYMIYKDGLSIQSGLWSSSELLNVSLPQSLGTYNYTFVANDTSGDVISNTAFVHVIDVIAPTITGYTYYSYNESTPGQFINWNITDNHPDYYTVYKDGVAINSNTWTANSTITVDVSGLLKGNYNYTLVANDTSNNINMLTTIVNVYDGTPPNITSYGNQTYEGGSTGDNITWTATDNYPAYYEIYNDSVLLVNSTWTSNVNISQVISSLTLGQFNFTIIVFDQSGNNITSTIFVTIVDTTPPVITASPVNETIDLSTSGHTITWSAMDFFPSKYTVYDNNSVLYSGLWLTDSETFNLDSLVLGLHNLTIVFNDTSGNFVSSTVWITTFRSDIIPPLILSSPSNMTYQDVSTGNSASWLASDNIAPGNYILYVDGSTFVSGLWFNDTLLTLNIDGLSAGIHNLTIVFSDASNNNVTNTIWVTVVDTTPPAIITHPTTTVFEVNAPNNNISWTAIDDQPDSYTLYINGTIYTSGSWQNATAVIIPFSGLSLGMYNFTIAFNDSTGNTAYNTVMVTIVTDTTAPQLSGISSLTIDYGSSGNNLTLNATDPNPATYEIYQNGTLIKSGVWTSNSSITLDLDSLQLYIGVYNITYQVSDSFGNVAYHTVIVTVQPIKTPATRPPNTSTSSSTPTPSTSETSTTSSATSTRTTITTQLTSSWNLVFLLLSFSFMFILRSRRK